MAEVQPPLATKHHRPLQFVREFTDIPRPSMSEEPRLTLGRYHGRFLAVAFADPRQQRVSEHEDVVPSFPQRGQAHPKQIETMQEILAKFPRRHQHSEISIGRRDDPRVDRDRPRGTHAPE